MTLTPLREGLTDLAGFTDLDHYRLFGAALLEYLEAEQPTLIHAPNDLRYRFYQFGEEYRRAITRPLNFDLWIEGPDDLRAAFDRMLDALDSAATDGPTAVTSYRDSGEMRRVLYTSQQAVGCVADSLGNSNQSRKRVGQVFERLMLLLVRRAGLTCEPRTVVLPVPGLDGFTMKYELDSCSRGRGSFGQARRLWCLGRSSDQSRRRAKTGSTRCSSTRR